MDTQSPGMEMGQLGRKLGWKGKWMGSNYLATCDNYHLTRKDDSYHLIILRGHLWGGRFKMAARERGSHIWREPGESC